MARVSTPPKGHRDRLLPLVAAGFAELGYRRATTAELARRCGVRENVLYRIWPSKKEMFLASIAYVSDASLEIWRTLLTRPSRKPAAQRVLEYEAVHHGELGLYRIVFAGLAETDDPDIREAMRQMYAGFHAFIVEQIHKGERKSLPEDELLGWAMVGLGTVSNISRELGLMGDRAREMLFRRIGSVLLADEAAG